MQAVIYANYGVLAHEHQIIYTANNPHRHADVSERITVEIPQKYNPYETVSGEIALSVPGMSWSYLLADVLDTMDGFPAISWYDGQRTHHDMLRVIDGADRLG